MSLISQDFTERLITAKTVADILQLQRDLLRDTANCLNQIAGHLAASSDLSICAPESNAQMLTAILPDVLREATPAAFQILGDITIDKLSEAFEVLETKDRLVNAAYFNIRDYGDLRMFGRDHIDFEVRRTMLQHGVIGRVYGVDLLVSKTIPEGQVYLASLAEGEMPLVAARVDVVRSPA